MCLEIHRALHMGSPSVQLDGKTYEFETPKYAKYRFLDINGIRFQKQNKSKPSKYGAMARAGHLITWGIRPSPKEWVRIIDDKVEVEP